MIELRTYEEPDQIYWRAEVNGAVVYRGSYPHFGAARALIDAGYSPDEQITSYAPNGTPAFRTTLGALAYLTVTKETRITPWRAPPSQRAKSRQQRFKSMADWQKEQLDALKKSQAGTHDGGGSPQPGLRQEAGDTGEGGEGV